MSSVGLATEIAYRSARRGDDEAIVTFLRECGYESDLAFWRWINRDGPHGPTMVELALDGSRVIGHYAILPRRLQAGGATVQAGQAIHATVHPQFRGLAVLQGLMRRVVQAAGAAGLPFLYGFPNAQIRLVYQKIFHWQPAGDLVALERPVGSFEPEAAGDCTVSCRARVQFDERYRVFEEPTAWQRATRVMKDPAYLQWRYANHPRVRYQLLEACAPSGALAGYAVLKRYAKGATVYGHLIDFAVRDGQAAAFRALVAAALSHFRQQRVDVASCWALPQTPYCETVQAMGFQPTGFTTHLGYRLLDTRFTADRLGLEHWHVVMGDSDAF